MFNIASIIWLEFSVLSEIAGKLFMIDEIYLKVIIIFISSFSSYCLL